MKILTKIKMYLVKSKEIEEITDFIERLKLEYGLVNLLYTTSEGLLIMGTFKNSEVIAARVPELLKILSELNNVNYYTIRAVDRFYHIAQVTSEVLFFAEGKRMLSIDEFKKICEITKKELAV